MRRDCAHYNFCHFCANSTHASTHTLSLRKKMAKKFVTCAKEKTRKKVVGFEPGTFDFAAQYSNHSATRPLCHEKENLRHIYFNANKICANLAHASTHAPIMRNFWRNCAFCAKICADLSPCALKNHYIAPRIRAFRRLGSTQ